MCTTRDYGICDKPEVHHNPAGEKASAKRVQLNMGAVSFVYHFKHLALFAAIAFSLVIAVTDGCTDDFDCDIEMYQVCCNSECVYGESCVGRYCTSDSNCSSDESCCSRECTSGDCSGSSCTNDTDCGVFETCCYGSCKYTSEECYPPLSSAQLAGVVVGAIIGSLFFICLFAACTCGRVISSANSEPTHTRITSRRRTTPVTVTNTRSVAQTKPPQRVKATIYTRCVVQHSYQQGYPYYPPPQQTTNRPPKIDNTLAATRQPPPYTAAPKGISEEVYAPQTSYGAVQTAQVIQ